jgi:riboflavin synthase
MFTGIIEQLGTIGDVREASGLLRVQVLSEPGDLALGGSIAVNGCCLTAVEVSPKGFSCELTPETLERTAFRDRLKPGLVVNLERPLRVSGRLDGHIVQGHVDGVGRIEAIRPVSDSAELEIEAPAALLRYLAPKGSVALDGISLTVVSAAASRFTVAVIPYTLKNTNLGSARPGGLVNLEMDILAKYVETLLRFRS